MHPRPPRQFSRRPSRGFTLVELMTVVIMITIFAAIAIPLATRQLQERRAQQAAEQVAMMYRDARLRAMGRGSAVLVRFSGSSQGSLEIREAQRGGGTECAALPVSSCLLPNWDAVADTDYRSLKTFDLSQSGEYAEVSVGMLDSTSASVSTLDVCFTPMGRAFYRTRVTDPMVPLKSTHVAELWRGASSARVGRTRKVLILPNGTARIQ